ncbi:MAG: deoxyguanosinetriphosphate triphosphohydrolase [Bacillota bacterium]|nr:MAG: deoxyguanosinetriphosphate triphosphohydrolase [Bacillota bacterium]
MREKTLQIEEMFLSPFAKKSADTAGRERAETPCPMRTEFQRDRDRIIHCKSFRRLKNKTQVFFCPEGDNYRTRLTHTIDVTQIARSIARALSLNEDLTEAIALGHDLGHTPFGHSGERVLDKLSPYGFKHNEQSLRVVEFLENDGQGLNLTREVKDGILNHKVSLKPQTLEGRAVSISDWIAYINHDIDDAIHGGLIAPEDLPKDAVKVLGKTSRERINSMIFSIYRASENKPRVEMEPEILEATKILREFMFSEVYFSKTAMAEEEKAERMLTGMYEYFAAHPDKLPPFYIGLAYRHGVDKSICDYISSMSDKYAYYVYENIFIPKTWGL